MGEVGGAPAVAGPHGAVKLLPPRLAKDPSSSRASTKKPPRSPRSTTEHHADHHRGVAGEHYFFVMELIPRQELREVMSQGARAAEALKIAVQICRAIDHAHAQGIIHRDLKPETFSSTKRAT